MTRVLMLLVIIVMRVSYSSDTSQLVHRACADVELETHDKITWFLLCFFFFCFFFFCGGSAQKRDYGFHNFEVFVRLSSTDNQKIWYRAWNR